MIPASARVPFILTYPLGHEAEGQNVTRLNECKCGEQYQQLRVNPDWLNSPAWKDDRARFRETFEITDTREVWIPKGCPKCERADLQRIKVVR